MNYHPRVVYDAETREIKDTNGTLIATLPENANPLNGQNIANALNDFNPASTWQAQRIEYTNAASFLHALEDAIRYARQMSKVPMFDGCSIEYHFSPCVRHDEGKCPSQLGRISERLVCRFILEKLTVHTITGNKYHIVIEKES